MSTPAPQLEYYRGADERRLAVRRWPAATRARARVVFLHGVTSHGGWYAAGCHHLATHGLEVHFLDRRGSGLNAEARGDVSDWRLLVDDVVRYLGRSAEPTFLLGISWGGKLACAVARRAPALVQGLGLVCPGLYSPFEPNLVKRLVLALPAPRRLAHCRVKVPLRRAELFTDSPAWQEFIARDPLALREITWRFAREDRRLTRYARAAASYLHMPMLLMLAGRDRIVDNERTRRFFARAAAPEKTLIEYPNAAHTLEFEPEPAQYFADLTHWVERHLEQ